MTGAERGVLLLCASLGQRDVKPLTMAQYRELSRRMTLAPTLTEDGQVTEETFLQLGYGETMAKYLVFLLSREDELDWYLSHGYGQSIKPVTKISPTYPEKLVAQWGESRPVLFFVSGNMSLWNLPGFAVVGSREPTLEARQFAYAMGTAVAKQNLVLVTGGAEGVDMTALEGCRDAGGNAVVFVPDCLEKRLDLAGDNCLVVSGDGYDLDFSTSRAHQRNGWIHSLAEGAIVVQPRDGKGGTWQGAVNNLKKQWSDVFVYDDGSPGATSLLHRGAVGITSWLDIAKSRLEQTTLF